MSLLSSPSSGPPPASVYASITTSGAGAGGARRGRGVRRDPDHDAHRLVVVDVLHIDDNVRVRGRVVRDDELDGHLVPIGVEVAAAAIVGAVQRRAAAGPERAARVHAEPEQRRNRTELGRVGVAVAPAQVGDLDVDRVAGALGRRGRGRGERRDVVVVVAVVRAAACLGVRLDHHVRRRRVVRRRLRVDGGPGRCDRDREGDRERGDEDEQGGPGRGAHRRLPSGPAGSGRPSPCARRAGSRVRPGGCWRPRPESNRRSGFCRPLPYHLATWPRARRRGPSRAAAPEPSFWCRG